MTTVAPDATPRSAVSSPEPNLTDITLRLLAEAGVPAGSIRDVRTAIAAGQVYSAATEAVHNGGGDKGMIEFFNCLDTVVEHIVEGRPMKPLRAAAEQVAAESATAKPGHYPWCAPGRCTTRTYDGETTTEHLGDAIRTTLRDASGDEISLHAGLGGDENLVDDTPTVSMYADGGDALLLLDTADLDKSIQELSDFVDGLRAMRRQMNQERRP